MGEKYEMKKKWFDQFVLLLRDRQYWWPYVGDLILDDGLYAYDICLQQ